MSKYGNKKCFFGGHKFDSKKERDRYIYLLSLEQKGKITHLEMQLPIVLQEKFIDNQAKKHRAIKYIADFKYITKEEITVYEDVKGFATDVYKIKMKMLQHKLKDITMTVFMEIK